MEGKKQTKINVYPLARKRKSFLRKSHRSHIFRKIKIKRFLSNPIRKPPIVQRNLDGDRLRCYLIEYFERRTERFARP